MNIAIEKSPKRKSNIVNLNIPVQNLQYDFKFIYDKDLDQMVVKIVDQKTDELIRKICSKSCIDLANNL